MTTYPGTFANAAKSTLLNDITVASVSLAAQSGDGAKFPSSGPYPIYVGTDGNTFERMLVSSRSGDTFTVVRGQVGGLPDQSPPRAWLAGTPFYLVSHDGFTGDPFGVGTIISGTYAPSLLTLAGNTAVATGAAGTIATAGIVVSRVNPAADRTGCILAAGTVDGQVVIVENVSASHSVTFDVSGTSNVADGTSSSVAALTAVPFIWNATTSLWYRVV